MAAVLFTPSARTISHCIRARDRQRALAGLLVVALLFMQFLGLAHGIAHAGWPPSATHDAQMSRNAALFNYLDSDEDEPTPGIIPVASLPSASVEPAPVAPGNGRSHDHHSCVEYDAAAGTAGVHVDYLAPPPLPGTSVLALWQAFASWDAPLLRHFSSRAPPC